MAERAFAMSPGVVVPRPQLVVTSDSFGFGQVVTGRRAYAAPTDTSV